MVLRLKKLAKLAKGLVLDMGYNEQPNPYLKDAIGIDMQVTKKPRNYKKLVKGDVTRTKFKSKTFDTVIAGELIEHIENPSLFLKECRRIMKNNGTLLITTPNPYFLPLILLNWLFVKKWYFKDSHINLFPPRIMLKLLWKNGFNLIKMKSGTGILFPVTKVTFPLPRMFSQHIIYICKKK